MRVLQGLLRVRFIVVLSLVYLTLVFLLYQYLWKTNSLEKGLSLLEFSQNSIPHDRDVFEFSGEKVEFNFRRHNGLLHYSNESSNKNVLTVALNKRVTTGTSSSTDPVPVHGRLMFNLTGLEKPSKCVHAFYYMWYGTPAREGKYHHWNHRYLPHWDARISRKYEKVDTRHVPPDDIGASFYPQLGCYSSSDPKVVEMHMYMLRLAGVGVVSVSWYPKGQADDEGFPLDHLIPMLLDIAHAYSIQVAIHIEPYNGRSAATLQRDLEYITKEYSKHPAMFKMKRPSDPPGKALPVVYLYDSYLISADEWARVLKPGRLGSIRGTATDCIVLALLVESSHKKFVLEGGFDGFYTYFAANTFSFGSNTANWHKLSRFAVENNLLFVPSFGPGYDDVQVRPWNERNVKSREDGAYYTRMFRAARTYNTGLVSLTSFNEWHEGTQIEASVPKVHSGYTYNSYFPHKPNFYLLLTRNFTQQMHCR